MSYRVDLPVFSGPMDLLLHLVRQQEVDIHQISISRILDGYLKHLEVLRELDLHDIGDFLVMASTLMELKSRELLPREAVEIEQELDPRDDLIQRLLQYKRYRDLARELEGRGVRRQLQSPLVLAVPRELTDDDDEDWLDLGEVGIWDLTDAFAKLLEEIGGPGELKIEIEKRDVAYYTERLLGLFAQKKEWRFEDLFDRGEGRYGLIGTLMALLEMMKQGHVRAVQEQCFAPIMVAFVGPDGLTAKDVLSGLEADEATRAARAAVAAEEGVGVEGVGVGEGAVNGFGHAENGAAGDGGDGDGVEGAAGSGYGAAERGREKGTERCADRCSTQSTACTSSSMTRPTRRRSKRTGPARHAQDSVGRVSQFLVGERRVVCAP